MDTINATNQRKIVSGSTSRRLVGDKSMNYGPDLTPKLRAQLEKEIAAFDEKATLSEIEREAVGGTSVDAYQEWQQSRAQVPEPIAANPDLLSEEEAVDFSKPELSLDITEAKKDIELLLTFREMQVWRLVMRKGMTIAEAAGLLHVAPSTVKTHLASAKVKVERGIK